jgi:hypothetical protein
MGTPASSKYARIPSQIVTTLGPAATAPTLTPALAISPSSVRLCLPLLDRWAWNQVRG